MQRGQFRIVVDAQVTRDRHQVAKCRTQRGQLGIAVDAAVSGYRDEAAERRAEREQHRVVVDAHVTGHQPRASWKRERGAELDQRAVAVNVQLPREHFQLLERRVHRRQCCVVVDLYVVGDEN